MPQTWRTFADVRAFAQRLKLKNSVAWHAWWKEHDRPADIPSAPSDCKAYAEEWAGWEDFLGDSYGDKKKTWNKKVWRNFVELRAFAHSLKLKNSAAWYAWWMEHDRPADIPSDPSKAYAEDWAGWEDFLGDSYVNNSNNNSKKQKAWRSFTELRTFARSLKLKNRDAWKAWWKEHDRPADIPSDPSDCKAYAEEWAGWEDFLGDSYVNMHKEKKKAWRSFDEVRAYAQSLNLRNASAWTAWWKKHDRPADIPSNPYQAYAEDWAGWDDFLGDSYVNNSNNNSKKQKAWRSFTAVRTFAQSLNLRNAFAWKAWSKNHERPDDIPSHPPRVYAEDWAGWEDFLGGSYGKTTTTTMKKIEKKGGKRKKAGDGKSIAKRKRHCRTREKVEEEEESESMDVLDMAEEEKDVETTNVDGFMIFSSSESCAVSARASKRFFASGAAEQTSYFL